MDESTIKAARALCDRATPGPWIEQLGFPLSHIVGVTCDEALEVRDAEFIAAARTLLPAALDALAATKAALAEAIDALDAIAANAYFQPNEFARRKAAALKAKVQP